MNITLAEIVKALVFYAILHTIVWVIMFITRPIKREAEHELKRLLIATHRKNGHVARLFACAEGDCKNLTMRNQQQAQLLLAQQEQVQQWL
jgi:hypothetical protein